MNNQYVGTHKDNLTLYIFVGFENLLLFSAMSIIDFANKRTQEDFELASKQESQSEEGVRLV